MLTLNQLRDQLNVSVIESDGRPHRLARGLWEVWKRWPEMRMTQSFAFGQVAIRVDEMIQGSETGPDTEP